MEILPASDAITYRRVDPKTHLAPQCVDDEWVQCFLQFLVFVVIAVSLTSLRTDSDYAQGANKVHVEVGIESPATPVLGAAIYQSVTRRHDPSPLIHAAKMASLASALTAMTLVQIALRQLGERDTSGTTIDSAQLGRTILRLPLNTRRDRYDHLLHLSPPPPGPTQPNRPTRRQCRNTNLIGPRLVISQFFDKRLNLIAGNYEAQTPRAAFEAYSVKTCSTHAGSDATELPNSLTQGSATLCRTHSHASPWENNPDICIV